MDTHGAAHKLTYDDYVNLPDDGLRHEIIGGEHFVTPSPSMKHQRVAVRLLQALANHLDATGVGEVFIAPFDVVLSPFDVVVPDLIYLSPDRMRALTSKNLQGAPSLVVEILSPSTRGRDLRAKRELYEREDVREYWVVDPDADTVAVYRQGTSGFELAATLSADHDAALSTPEIEGLNIPLRRIFS